MADATTADVLDVQKETLKKITFIGNVLNKNIVPASAQKEKDSEDNAWKKRLFGFMSGFQDQFGNMTEALKFKMKAAGGGLLSMLKKGALLMAIPAILALLQSDMWKTIKDWFVNSLLPALKSLWEGLKELWVILEPHVTKFLNWLKTEGLSLLLAGITASLIAVTALFDDISAALSGEGSWISVLMENKAAIAAISLLLFPKLTFFLVKTAAAGIGLALNALKTHIFMPMVTSLAHGLFSLVTGAATKLASGIMALKTVVIGPMITSLATGGMAVVTTAMASLRTAILFLQTQVITPMITSLATAGMAVVTTAMAALRTAILFLQTQVITPMITSLSTAGMAVVTSAMAALRTAILFLQTQVITPMITSLATGGMAVVTTAMASLRTAIMFLNTTIIQPMITSLATTGLMYIQRAAAALRAALIALNTSVIVEMTKSLAVAGLKYIVLAAQALRAAVIAMNGAILAPMLVALGPALVVAAPFILIAAAVALAIKSLYDAFLDAKAIFDETGDIWLALSEGLSSFLATFMGFIPDMIKNIISWGLKKLGFDAASAWLDSFSIVDSIKGMFRNMFDGMFQGLGNLLGSGIDLAVKIWDFVKALPGKVWDWLKKTVLGWFGIKDETEAITGEIDAADQPEKGWLSSLIGTALNAVIGFFKDIFDIDWGATFTKLISAVPGGAKILDFFGVGGADPAKAKQAALDAKVAADAQLAGTQAEITRLQGQMPGEANTTNIELRAADRIKSEKEDAKSDIEKIKAELTEMEEELRQSELFIKTGGEQGKDTVWNMGSDVEGEKGALADKRAAILAKKGEIATDITARETQMGVNLGNIETQKESDIANVISANDAEKIRIQEEIKSLQTRELEQQKVVATAIESLAKAGVEDKKSIAVHDRHVESAIIGLMQMTAAQTALLAAYGNGGSSGGSTTVNNVTVSPSTSNTVSSVQKSENTYGTVDPYTSASGAYG